MTRAMSSLLRKSALVLIGVGIATLPVHVGDSEDDLVRALDPVPELMSYIYLLVHPDLRNTPRVRALFDFLVAQMAAFRPLLAGKAGD